MSVCPNASPEERESVSSIVRSLAPKPTIVRDHTNKLTTQAHPAPPLVKAAHPALLGKPMPFRP